MTAPLRAAVYVRLSSYRDDDPSLSPASQEESCRALALARGWDVVDVVTDLDESASDKGRRLERPGLAELLRRLGDVDVIVARDLSRFARSVADFTALAETCRAEGVALATTKEALDLSTPSGRFVATILAAFAEMEAASTGERVTAHRAAAAKAGRYAGGKPPFGYRTAPALDGAPGSVLVPDEAEAATLRRAVRLLLEGRSLYRTAALLNEAEETRPRSGVWDGTRLKRAVLNPAAQGVAIYKGEPVRDADGLPSRPYAPVLSTDDVEHLRALLERPAGAAPRRARSALLSGLAVCGVCGAPLHRAVLSQSARGNSPARRYDVYRCGGRSAGRDCTGVTIKGEHLDDFVADEFLYRFGFFREMRAVERVRPASGLADVEAALRDATEAMREPGADVAALAARVTTLASKRDALAAVEETTTEVVDTGRTMAEAWEAADLLERQRLLADVVDVVRVGRGVRGRRAFDPSRVALVMRGEEDEGA